MYIAEIASKEIRGFVLIFFQLFAEIGITFVYTIGSLVNLKTLNITCACLLVTFTISFMFLPESPIFLIRKNKIDEAVKSLKLLRGSTYDTQLEIRHFKEIIDTESKLPKTPIHVEIQKRETLKAFFIILAMFFFFQMSGIIPMTFYTTAIFIDAGIEMSPSLATIIIGIVQVLSTLVTAAFIDRFGRVFMLATSFVIMTIGLSGVATFFLIRNIPSYGNLYWLPLPSLCISVIGFSVGIGPIIFVLLGELFSDNAKSVIAPFTQTMNFLISFGIGILYPALVHSIGNGATFFIFAGFCVLGLLFTLFVVPETKGKSLDEIQTLLKK